MRAIQNEDAIIENLCDAGCDQKLINDVMDKYSINKDECIKILENYRKCLLSDLHGCEKKIDCLDYLIFELKGGCHV